MTRPRKARRALERDLDKARDLARRVHELGPGGSPDRPVELVSPSQVDVDAVARPCPICAGTLQLDAHEVAEHRGLRLRLARSHCRACGARWSRYYRIGAVLN
jgi:hypothetical protein